MKKDELIVHKDPKSPISEIFRTLRTNIQFMDAGKNSKTILVTSTFASEGKSWTSSNLAVAFAQTGKKVLLIDADMRKGRQYSIFRVSPKPGLSNYLSGVSISEDGKVSENVVDYVQRTEVANLYVMVAGNIPPNPSELLISSKMVNLLEEAKQLWDIIIIDGTPSQLVTDSLILARIVDSTILVTACKETKKEDLKRVISNIQNVGGKLSGVVLNKVPIQAKKYQQSYYYGSSSSESRSDTRRSTTRQSTIYANNQNTIDSLKQEETKKVEKNNEASVDKANDILKQINDYLDNEKKKLS